MPKTLEMAKHEENASEPMSFRFTPTLALKIRESAGRITDGNLSEFARQIFEAALYPEAGNDPDPMARRAAEYVVAKEASIMFEEDVHTVLERHFGKAHVERDARFPGPDPYVADFRINLKDGACIVEAKSSPRRDRVELALGQAMIAKSRVRLPVVAVVPYFLEETRKVAKSFDDLGCKLVTLSDLIAAIEEVTERSKRPRQ